MPEHVIKFSKIKLALLNLALAAVIVFVFTPWLHAEDDVRTMLVYAAAPFILLAFGFFVRKLFDTRPGIILNDQGLTDHSTGTSIGFVPWSDITGIKQTNIKGQKILSVLVTDPQKYWRKGGLFKRVSNWFGHKIYGSPVNISTGVLSASAAEVTALIEEYRIGATGRRTGPALAAAPARARKPQRDYQPVSAPQPNRTPIKAAEPNPRKPAEKPRDPRYDYSDLFDRSGRY